MVDPEELEQCKISGYRSTGNKVSFQTICTEDGVTSETTVEMTFSGDSFTGLAQSTSKGREMKMRTTAKRTPGTVPR
jgi:hypothetical protein